KTPFVVHRRSWRVPFGVVARWRRRGGMRIAAQQQDTSDDDGRTEDLLPAHRVAEYRPRSDHDRDERDGAGGKRAGQPGLLEDAHPDHELAEITRQPQPQPWRGQRDEDG